LLRQECCPGQPHVTGTSHECEAGTSEKVCIATVNDESRGARSGLPQIIRRLDAIHPAASVLRTKTGVVGLPLNFPGDGISIGYRGSTLISLRQYISLPQISMTRKLTETAWHIPLHIYVQIRVGKKNKKKKKKKKNTPPPPGLITGLLNVFEKTGCHITIDDI